MIEIGTGHIGPHLFLCVIMDIDSRYIIAFRFGKSNSDKLKQSLCNDLCIEQVPASTRVMSSFFGSLSSEQMLLYRFHNNEERMEAAANWIDYYNTRRLHSALGGRTPYEAFKTIYNVEAIQE